MKFKFFFILFLINFNFIFPADFDSDFELKGMTFEEIAQDHERQCEEILPENIPQDNFETELTDELNSEKELKHDFVEQKIKKEKINDEILKCNNCNAYETFDTRNFKRHVKKCENLRLYQCEHCGEKFNQRTTLVIHLRIHFNEKKFKCAQCAYSTYTQGQLNKHFKNIHTNIKDFKCPYCHHEDKIKANFIRHLITQHFFCFRCNTKYKSREVAEACDKSHPRKNTGGGRGKK